jgi:hypothetical protein
MPINYFSSKDFYSNVVIITLDVESQPILRVVFNKKHFVTKNKNSQMVEHDHQLGYYNSTRDFLLKNLKHAFIIGRNRSV